MIEKWLHNVRPPKYLRYLYFIAYSWYRRHTTHRGNAHILAIGFIGISHMLVYQAVYFFVFTSKIEKSSTLVIVLILLIQFYYWFFYREKWKLYIKEFDYIKIKQQKQNVIYLFIYLFIYLSVL